MRGVRLNVRFGSRPKMRFDGRRTRSRRSVRLFNPLLELRPAARVARSAPFASEATASARASRRRRVQVGVGVLAMACFPLAGAALSAGALGPIEFATLAAIAAAALFVSISTLETEDLAPRSSARRRLDPLSTSNILARRD